MEKVDERLIKQKLIALFHDPAWKPWVLLNSIRGGSVEEWAREKNVRYYTGSEDRHERDGLTVLMYLTGMREEEIRENIGVVHNADEFSASLDRFLLPPQSRMGIHVPEKKVNVFNPDFYLQVNRDIGIDVVVKYLEALKHVVDQVPKNDLSTLYNALYASIEPAWYNACPNCIPLADTRVYTYTVFDHVYATASMVNLVADCSDFSLTPECFRGSLVLVDLPGVQQIVSKARKTWDLWAGSWLISYLAFSTVKPFIERYGADVVLSPFMGFNPFFVWYVDQKLKGSKISELYGQELKGVMEAPTQPVMPATVTLALPERGEGIEDEVEGYYVRAWDDLLERVGNQSLRELLKGSPITPIKVTVLDVKEFVGNWDLMGKVRELSRKTNVKDTSFSALLFSDMVEELHRRARKVKVSYGVTAFNYAHQRSSEYYSSKRLYRLCTVCGVLPAEFYSDPGEGGSVDRENLEEGEALCPFCYLKRVLHKHVKDILGSNTKVQIIPSTIDIANVNTWRKVLKLLKEGKISFVGETEDFGQLPSPLKEYDSRGASQYFYYRSVANRLMLCLLGSREGNCKGIEGEVELLRKEGITPEIYYAVVKGDGDFVGRRLMRGILGISLEEYAKKTRANVNEELLDAMKGLLKGDRIPVTPDYLITLSRALMAVALRDMLEVEKEGFLIYAGGDDVAFLSPPGLTPIELVLKTRQNYWGTVGYPGSMGFNQIGNVIVDAPIAYGRSYSVYLAHYRDPFFYAFQVASELEEVKDREGLNEKKDVTFVLKARGSFNYEDAAVIRNLKVDKLDTESAKAGLGELLTLKHLEDVYKLLEEGKLSSSFVKDSLELYGKYGAKGLNVETLLNYAVERNKTVEGSLGSGLNKFLGLQVTAKLEGEVRDARVEIIKAIDYLR